MRMEAGMGLHNAAFQGAWSDRMMMILGELSMVRDICSGIPVGAMPVVSRDHFWICGLFPEECVVAESLEPAVPGCSWALLGPFSFGFALCVGAGMFQSSFWKPFLLMSPNM